MTEARAWLDSRTPSPPGELLTAAQDALEGAAHRTEGPGGGPEDAIVDTLARAAAERLAAALERPGRVRASAFELLTSDALATYAAEAALEAEDPDGALVGLARRLLDASGTA